MKEFNLSDKINTIQSEFGDSIFTKDVKEFIRRLKEEIDLTTIRLKSKTIIRNQFLAVIDKLAGASLTQTSEKENGVKG